MYRSITNDPYTKLRWMIVAVIGTGLVEAASLCVRSRDRMRVPSTVDASVVLGMLGGTRRMRWRAAVRGRLRRSFAVRSL